MLKFLGGCGCMKMEPFILVALFYGQVWPELSFWSRCIFPCFTGISDVLGSWNPTFTIRPFQTPNMPLL